MLEKRHKLKKFVVLGIVAMFASMAVIVLQAIRPLIMVSKVQICWYRLKAHMVK